MMFSHFLLYVVFLQSKVNFRFLQHVHLINLILLLVIFLLTQLKLLRLFLEICFHVDFSIDSAKLILTHYIDKPSQIFNSNLICVKDLYFSVILLDFNVKYNFEYFQNHKFQLNESFLVIASKKLFHINAPSLNLPQDVIHYK